MMNRKPILTQAMHLMDHTEEVMSQAKEVAMACYEDQGLPQHAQQVVVSAAAMKTPQQGKMAPLAKGKPSRPKSTREKAPKANDWLKGVGSFFVVMAPLLMALLFCSSLAFLLLHESASTPTASSAPAPVPYQKEVENLRLMAAALQTEDMVELAKGVQPKNVSADERDGLALGNYMAIQKLGPITVTDREGRPELRWSQVSQAVCHALVQDIYDYPSPGSGVEVTIDGQNAGVSCAGPNHTIVLTPHL
jgi:hypothetical protein